MVCLLGSCVITCDIFDLSVVVENRTIRWSVSTDLPGGTQFIVDVSRRYTDTRGDSCLWSLWSGRVVLTEKSIGDRNGATGIVSIDDGDACGLAQFNELLGPYSSGTLGPVGPEIHVEATVGARQVMKAFGKNNCNLAGDMVANSGGINIVQAQVIVSVEMRPEYQPVEVE